ncbi:uncharacterized protein LAESUDRAFT_762394 [Laetiporus sulphureus 93-53]|uniref:Uncharacterized protein n=1 Tax=Laetiporus sulphureus 93-53 TaxID=1314785 RepID=A0A165CKG5_9APHY|nr:uncharacterized protein LAESUDRAFT_762394 [Laetiporus sulphureus 93-53]KZT02976.1 hypothetical protein LAESUDRAFT_762394 [Laetiporus sulphureus 93-53]
MHHASPRISRRARGEACLSAAFADAPPRPATRARGSRIGDRIHPPANKGRVAYPSDEQKQTSAMARCSRGVSSSARGRGRAREIRASRGSASYVRQAGQNATSRRSWECQKTTSPWEDKKNERSGRRTSVVLRVDRGANRWPVARPGAKQSQEDTPFPSGAELDRVRGAGVDDDESVGAPGDIAEWRCPLQDICICLAYRTITISSLTVNHDRDAATCNWPRPNCIFAPPIFPISTDLGTTTREKDPEADEETPAQHPPAATLPDTRLSRTASFARETHCVLSKPGRESLASYAETARQRAAHRCGAVRPSGAATRRFCQKQA